MAISIERVYSIYFPFHSYKFNSFKTVTKIMVVILILSLAEVIVQAIVGFCTENFTDTSVCVGMTVIGDKGAIIGVISFSISSAFIRKLLQRQKVHSTVTSVSRRTADYNITKMLTTGNVLYFLFNSTAKLCFTGNNRYKSMLTLNLDYNVIA